MKSFLISDNIDTLIGMRLSGVDGVICQTREEVLKTIEEKIKDVSIGVIVVTDIIKNMATTEIMEYKIKLDKTLIVEIPSINSKYEKNYITKYIRDSIGVKF
ncbi:V-type ATP synthase subunit F [Helicovermis profundi]|uniref:ATP synthase subunit F n=1 Tax=Helicovermis profundi TaxID=3065157 RepID=A0AAU9E9U2_9FIRM|nr:hypothetical protein HLPR_25990 [Clostridia bacterium S502]